MATWISSKPRKIQQEFIRAEYPLMFGERRGSDFIILLGGFLQQPLFFQRVLVRVDQLQPGTPCAA